MSGFYVRRTRADGTSSLSGPVPRETQAASEAKQWGKAGFKTEVLAATPELDAEMSLWDAAGARRNSVTKGRD